ncbi:MAG: thiamine-phosphate kinase [Candidatus Eremiobacteraeota bacterium]|nr:thiamine-phosphate kinase [Candidatus Eremiobacteraeota bacterium]MBV8434230.1 thiamine-phosphate kinase [Candidatus Eremiobacteraeota bacterium]MBV8584030.1 thiamine-phosphate kinase [Candidatus Eremiobacteraeota bacterium]MBV8655295.1 thiamine-phosphate kinase [Candidatus Eremiobacteraeota bacterium]
MNEDALVAAIAEIAGSPKAVRIVVGIGDDAALWQPSRSHRSAITSDMLVEGVHFTRELMSLEDAGWRAMAANASDLAAMGARPLLATVGIGMPEGAALDDIRSLYAGLAACARACKLAIVGGDLSRSNAMTIAVTAVGEVRAADAKLRSGGRAGDVVAVTGALGAARAGLAAAKDAALLAGDLRDAALAAFRRPSPRCDEGRFLAASQNVDAMMDCSDGVSTDLDRLCAASGVGANVDFVPVANAADAAARALGEDPEAFALAGGEDFELLTAVRPRAFPYVARRFRARFGRELLRIGTLRAEPGVALRGKALARTGWDHFARAGAG